MNPELARLTASQQAALSYVGAVIGRHQDVARDLLAQCLRESKCPSHLLDAATDSISEHARVVLHFHPDRLSAQGITVAEAFLEDGAYRNQFETGLSSGSRTAFPGGDRDRWERTLFGGAYHGSDIAPSERPKYGALELVRYPDGPLPRFGSCYFILKPAVSMRTSFTFSGSEQDLALERLGLIGRMEGVMASLLSEIFAGEGAQVPWPPYVAPTLGLADPTVTGFLEDVSRELALPRSMTANAGRVLDSGIEAQVHGPVEIEKDVEHLVVDPSFERTPTGEHLRQLCRRHSIPLDWHCGFRLEPDEVPGEFRGPAVRRIAARVARNGTVDAAAIGIAEASLRAQPELWEDLGSRDEVLQYLKQLWHVLVHYGDAHQELPLR